MTEKKNQPIAELRVGRVKAKIWANETSNGTLHNVTFSRLYVVTTEENGEEKRQWRESSSFSQEDLLGLAKAADQAFDRMLALGEASRVPGVLISGIHEADRGPGMRLVEDSADCGRGLICQSSAHIRFAIATHTGGS